MIFYMHFKGIKIVAPVNKSKKLIKYVKNENIMIKTNRLIQHICLTDFAI